MKIFSLLLASIILFSYNMENKNNPESDWKKYQVTKNVKKIIEREYVATKVGKEIKMGENTNELSFNFDISFDKNGKKIEKIFYQKGIVVRRITYKYKGEDITEERIYNGDNSLNRRIIYKYNENLLSAKEVYDSNGELMYETFIKRKKNNEGTTEVFKYHKKDITSPTNLFGVYDYESKSGWGLSQEGKSILQVSAKHNEKGECSETEYFQGEKLQKKVTFKYKYDKKGNWIEKVGYTGDTPETIVVRKIEYF